MSVEHDPGLPTTITWSHFYPDTEASWGAQPTSVLVRFVARAEFLMASDPVRARSQGERLFRVGLEQIYIALDSRIRRVVAYTGRVP